jgi:hypothetical protein
MDAVARTAVARVVGAYVIIVTRPGRARLAGPRTAAVALGARVAVVTRQRVGGEDATTLGRIAAVIGTAVGVVAGKCLRARLAEPAGTGIAHRALIEIIAGYGVVGMDTTRGRLAGIIGAIVGVVAVQRWSARLAGSPGAGVAYRAQIAVLAGGSVVYVSANAGRRIAAIVCTFVGVIAVNRRAYPAGSGDAGLGAVTQIVVITVGVRTARVA